eukprot:TRINITY_DN34_c3_g2_i1.p1 TRINITY_DN34_c3_g2~~TRINITY_DN34_c3_g2_i1.p1  ORF type:complete len:258 (+),score=58.57 TRINITY_DN34_c3_g2_i1:72-845(+)
MDDPFYTVSSEVNKTLNGVKKLFKHWKTLKNSNNSNKIDEINWTESELNTGIQSIEWDLQDLEQAINIAKENSRFSIDETEIKNRTNMVKDIKNQITRIKNSIENKEGTYSNNFNDYNNSFERNKDLLFGSDYDPNESALDRNSKYRNDIVRSNAEFIQQEQKLQSNIIKDDDKKIDELEVVVHDIKNIALDMEHELIESNKELDEFEVEVEATNSRVRQSINKVNKLIDKADNKCGWFLVIMLSFVLVILIVLLFL